MTQDYIERIIEAFKNDEETFINTIEDLDSWNGYLGDDRYYSMDELDEWFVQAVLDNI